MSLWWGCNVLDGVLFLSPAFCWRESFDTGHRWKPKSLCHILYILPTGPTLMKADGALPRHLIGAIEAAAHAMFSLMVFTSTVLPYNDQLKAKCPTIKNKEITQGESYRLTHTELVCLPTTKPGLRKRERVVNKSALIPSKVDSGCFRTAHFYRSHVNVWAI